MKTLFATAAALAVAVVLYAASLYDYLLFHSLAETFSVIIACGIFMVAWNSRHYTQNQYLLFIGIAYLFIGILDLAHTFSYEGMALLPSFEANAPTQLWIAARYLESLTLLIAPLMLRRRIRPGVIIAIYSGIVLLVLLSIFDWRIFPDCYLAGAGGLTPFKKISEYAISLILIAAGDRLIKNRDHFDPQVLRWMLISIAMTVFSELTFTEYASVYGLFNLIGHYLKIISFFFIYKAIIQTGLAKPYDLLFRDLYRQREWLRVTLGSIGDAVIATDTAGQVTFLNPIAAQLTGWGTQEALGQPIRNVLRTINENSRQPAEDIAARVLEQGRIVNMANHTALISRDGREIPIEDSAAPIRDNDGSIIGAVIVFHDVTENRRAQLALQESEKRFRSVVASNMIGVVFADPASGNVTDANDEYLRIIGRTRAELTAGAINWKEITPPELLIQENRLVTHHPVDRPIMAFEKEYLRPDGTRVPVIVGRSFLDDTRRRMVAYVLDNTQRKAAETALRRNREKFELLSRTAGRLLATEEPRALVSELCRQVMDFLDCQAFFNFLVDEQAGKLHLNAFAGIAPAEGEKIEWLDFGIAVCGCVARDGQRIIAEDILHMVDQRTDLVKSYGIQAYCCHPLIVQDKVIGTLSFGTKTRPHFAREEVDLMRTVADQVALAMQRIQTQQMLRDHNEILESKVRQRTAELAAQFEKLTIANAKLDSRAHQLATLAGELTMTEQRERKRLAKILHDGLQQHLAAAKMQVGAMLDQLTHTGHKQRLAQIEAILIESIQMSRSLSAELSPPVLYNSGLSEGLEWLRRWMQSQYTFRVDLSLEAEPQLPEAVKILLFEAIRELLFNAVKHAKVPAAKVLLQQPTENEIKITVSDEGVGFDPAVMEAAGCGGLGLFSIRERIGLIGGFLEIDSAPQKGSRFVLRVSLLPKEAQSAGSPDALRQAGLLEPRGGMKKEFCN